MVSAPSPRSVGVKLPWPKKGNTALPTTRSTCGLPPAATGTSCPTRSPSWRSTEEPSTISPSEPGGRPSRTVEDISGPRPGARPIAGMTVAPIPMVPWTPNVQPAMPGTWAVSWSNCRGEMPPNCSSMAASQSCPYSRGVSTSRSRFAPNVAAPATAATATARPSTALRTGTAARPLPGSSANRIPVTAASGAPARASRSAVFARCRDDSWPAGAAGCAGACRQAVTATRTRSRAVMAANPTARTGTLTATPGSGSASRAGPIGISGDAATAMTHAPAAPAAEAAVTSARPAAISWRRVMPRAASVPLSWAAASSVRVATWPTISHAHSATASANRPSATACGRIDRSIVAACADSSATKTWPPVAGKRLARASAAAL